MRRCWGVSSTVIVVMLAGCAGTPPASAPPVVVEELVTATTTASGQPIRLPQGDARLVLSEYLIAPGARLPVHKHPSTRLAIVQAGTLSVTNQDTGETVVYGPGDLIVEAVDQWHFGLNIGTTSVRLLVLDETTGTESNTILQQ